MQPLLQPRYLICESLKTAITIRFVYQYAAFQQWPFLKSGRPRKAIEIAPSVFYMLWLCQCAEGEGDIRDSLYVV